MAVDAVPARRTVAAPGGGVTAGSILTGAGQRAVWTVVVLITRVLALQPRPADWTETLASDRVALSSAPTRATLRTVHAERPSPAR